MSGTITTGKLILTKTTANQDAFDRLRVSEPFTLFEINHTKGKNPMQIDEILAGGATSNPITDYSYIQMAIDTGTTGKCIRQSYEYVVYQPGKSKLLVMSAILETHGGLPNVISRVGTFDSSVEKTVSGTGNGLFFELNNTDLYAVIRNNNIDNSVKQSSWNFDKFDGLGPSGIIINDFSKCILFAVDMEWLGVGKVRFGFFINGQFWVGHSFNHSGFNSDGTININDAITYPYIKTAKLPIRQEITSSATGGLTGPEMRMMCSTILSEGGFDPIGIPFAIGATAVKTIGTSATAIISIRLKESEPSNRKTALLKKMSLLNTTSNRYIQWDLYLLPDSTTLTGGTGGDANDGWINVNNNSCCQYNITSTLSTTSNAILLESGYTDYLGNITFNYEKYLDTARINSAISGKSRVLCLSGIQIGGDCDVIGALSWIEIL